MAKAHGVAQARGNQNGSSLEVMVEVQCSNLEPPSATSGKVYPLLEPQATLEEKMESVSNSVKKKATERQHKAEVIIAGEQLRYMVKNLCDEHSEYKDVKLLYRFRKDDGTFPLNKEMKVFMRGQSLYEKLISMESSILMVREENGVKYQRTVLGCEMIDWLIQEGETSTRKEAVDLCRALLEHGILQHVSNRHHFFDSNLLYQFRINFRRRRRLTELLNDNLVLRSIQECPESPFCLRKLNPEQGNSSFLSVQPNKELKVLSAVRRSSVAPQSGVSGNYYSSTPSLSFPPAAECNPKSVLRRPISNEELLSPGAPYLKKTLTIVGDDVGWGFVVRGGRPCYIQAVDPGGPAAAAGMKVRQFVFAVNGMHVLHLDYQMIKSLIMTGPRTLVMQVMEAIE
nr:PREDICTED: DEP domain-containing mTOR-interacting protein-like [Latimeria chalumnae]|eukprot:XP_014342409.1 PREDICTED: DEP domain-containing mTOR-interacting protein-like [Latimeria chalumnae]